MWGLPQMLLAQKNIEPVFKVLWPCEPRPHFFMKIATSKILNIERTEILFIKYDMRKKFQ